MVSRLGIWASLGALSLCAGLSGCQPAPRAAAPRVAKPEPGEIFWNQKVELPASERIVADVSLFGVRAGAFNMELQRSCDGGVGQDIALHSEMSTVGVVRWFKATDGNSFTTMSSDHARPTHSELTVFDGRTRRTYRATLGPGGVETTIEKDGGETKRVRENTPGGEHPLDMQSAFMLLRHWRTRPGTHGYFYVLLGRHLWRVDVRFRGEVAMPLRDSERPAVEIEGRAERVKVDPDHPVEGRHFAMWLSPDADRVPLRVVGDASFGTVDFELTSHERTRESGIAGYEAASARARCTSYASERVRAQRR